MKSYIVINMIEADFGCEGRPEGAKTQTEVILRDEESNTISVNVDDAELVKKDINEGDWIHFTSQGEIVKEFI